MFAVTGCAGLRDTWAGNVGVIAGGKGFAVISNCRFGMCAAYDNLEPDIANEPGAIADRLATASKRLSGHD